MNLKLTLFSAACLTYFVIPASGTSLLTAAAAIKGTVIEADDTGAVLSSSNSDGTLVIQTHPGSVAVEAVPAQPIVIQQPVQYQPPQMISVIPVATIPSSNSLSNKFSNLLGCITNAINGKARAVSDFLRSLCGPPRIILIKVNTTSPTSTPATTTTTTTTTTTPKPTSTTHKPVIVEIVAEPYRRIQPRQFPAIAVKDCDKK